MVCLLGDPQGVESPKPGDFCVRFSVIICSIRCEDMILKVHCTRVGARKCLKG